MFYIDCYETQQGGKMEGTIDTTPEEILDVHRYGQKQGFIAGIAVCFGLRYLYNRRQKYQDALAEARQNRIR
jgi:hypothetical protein